MNVVLAVELIENLDGRVIRCVLYYLVAPLEASQDFSTLIAIKNSRSLRCQDISVRVRPNDKGVHNISSLSQAVEMTGMAQVVAPVDIAPIHLFLTGLFRLLSNSL